MSTKRKALLVALLVIAVLTMLSLACTDDLNVVKTGGEIVREIAPQVKQGYDASIDTGVQLVTHGLP